MFPIAWIGIGFALFFRGRRKQVAYLRRFPPIDSYRTLDTYASWVGNPPDTFRRWWEALYTRHSDPELERLRKEIQHDAHLIPLWMIGFPLVTFGVVALLTVIGLVHPR